MFFVLFLIISLLLGISNNFKIVSVDPADDLQPMIEPDKPQKMEWLGGDGSASIPFVFGDDEYSVWTYGDTILGSVDESGTRNFTYFIANTVGVSKKGDSKKINLFWKTSPKIDAMFVPPEKDIKLWLMTLFAEQNDDGTYNLYIFSPRVNLTDGGICGESVIKCVITRSNVHDPLLWQCSQHVVPFSISSKENGWTWGLSSASLVDGYVYLSGENTSDPTSMFFSRIKINDFEALKWNLEYFDGDDTWSPDISKIKAVEGLDRTPETTLTFNSYLKKWVMITNKFLSFDAFLYTSDSFTGPYTKTLLYKVPAPFSTTKNVFCYAFKVHTEFGKKDEMIFTYNCNSFDFITEYQKLDQLYIPQFVRVVLEN